MVSTTYYYNCLATIHTLQTTAVDNRAKNAYGIAVARQYLSKTDRRAETSVMRLVRTAVYIDQINETAE